MSSVSLLSESSVLLTSGSETSDFSSVVLLGNDPVDSWVLSDGVMGWVNKDDLEELLSGVLSHPVGVEDSEVGASSSNSLLGKVSEGSGLLLLVNTLMDWLTEDGTLVNLSLSSSSSDGASVDGVSLLGLVSEGSGFIDSGWSVDLVDRLELSVLPASDSHDESDDIGLLLSPELLQVLVGTHFCIKTKI